MPLVPTVIDLGELFAQEVTIPERTDAGNPTKIRADYGFVIVEITLTRDSNETYTGLTDLQIVG